MIGNFFTAFIGYGVPIGLVLGLLFWNPLKGAVLGASAGFLFAVLLTVFAITQEKKMQGVRGELEKEGTVFYAGRANQWQGRQSLGGILFLCEKEIYFVPHKFNLSMKECRIPYAEIQEAGKSRKIKSIYLRLKDGRKEEFVVNNRKKWIEQLNARISD